MAGFKYKRSLTDQGTVDPSQVEAISFDVFGGGRKGILVAPYLQLLGALNTAVDVNMGAVLQVFNSDTAIHYVALGTTSSISTPSSPANGIPIPAGTYVTVALGPNSWIKSDSATVYGYKMLFDNTLIAQAISE